MSIFFGKNIRVIETGSGLFYCPSCKRDQRYSRRETRERLEIFFLPVTEGVRLKEEVECNFCSKTFPPSTLQSGRPPHVEGVDPEFDRIQVDAPGLGVQITVSGLASNSNDLFDDSHRTDPAATAWRVSPERYKSAFSVSSTPTCPYCNESLGQRKEPTRRSKFGCPSCKLQIWVDPYHSIFPSIYLRDRQGLVAKYLGNLDVGTFRNGSPSTAGRAEDFWWQADRIEWTKGKRDLSDLEAADVLWGLFHYNMSSLPELLHCTELGQDKNILRLLQESIESYRKEETNIKSLKGVAPQKNVKVVLPAEERLATAMKQLPIPAGFRDAAVALRAIIREGKKQNGPFKSNLKRLYVLLAQSDFLYRHKSYADFGPAYNVASSITKKAWKSLEMPYDLIGYKHLGFAKTDIKWFVQEWGEPTEHLSAQDFHQQAWEDFLSEYRAEREKDRQKSIQEWKDLLS